MGKQREVNEIFEYRWATIQCVLVEGTGACNKCHFIDDGCINTMCMPKQRTDGENVVFIRIKKENENEKKI